MRDITICGAPGESWGIEKTSNGYKVNAQLLIERYLKEYPIVYDKRGVFYGYDRKGVWIEKHILTIKKLLRRIVNLFVPYIWDTGVNAEVLSYLPVICLDFNLLRPATNFINLKNGLLDLTTFKLVPHSKEFASLVQLPFTYDPEAECPKFHRFLDQVFMGDKELKLLTQEIMGYCLSPSTQAQKCFIFYSDGSSGKSVLCSILHRLAGGDANVSSVTLSNLNAKFTRAQLYGKVVNISTENETSNFNSEALKAITSGDPIQIENKYEKPFTAKLTAKLVFAMNTLPTPSDNTFALFRRLCIVPFLAKFVDNPREGTNEFKRNPNMEEELTGELSGILTWCIEGLKRLVANGYQFTRSIEAEKAMLEYSKDIKPVNAFIEECVRRDTPANRSTRFPRRLTTNNLFEAYEHWSVKNRIRGILSKREFLRRFREGLNDLKLPCSESHSGNYRFFRGLCLEKNAQRDLDDEVMRRDDSFDEGEYIEQDYDERVAYKAYKDDDDIEIA